MVRRNSHANTDCGHYLHQEAGSLTVLAACPRAPKWTIPGKWPEGKDPGEKAPGPGHYNLLAVDEKQRTNKGLSFGPKVGSFKSDRFDKARPGPGPGQYNSLGEIQVHVPGGTIGRSDLPADPASADREKMPGPGNYNIAVSTLEPKGGAIICDNVSVRRRDSESGPFNPPADMAPLASRPEPPKFSFGRASRPTSAGSTRTNAGPDLYMPPSTLRGGAASLAAGHVPPETGRFEVRPDPTTYTPLKPTPALPRQPFTRARRPVSAPPGGRAAEVDKAPGPGSYNVSVLKDRTDSAPKIGTGQRAPLHNAAAGQFPGPGSYNLLSSLSGEAGGGPLAKSASSQAFSFGKAKRQAAEGTPEPAGRALALWEAACLKSGTDGRRKEPSCLGGRGPRLPPRREPGCHGRHRRQTFTGPGPGAFSPKLVRGSSAPALSIGRAPRFPKDKAGSGPGPGDYQVAKGTTTDRGVSIAKAQREGLERRTRSPGPASYKAYGCIG